MNKKDTNNSPTLLEAVSPHILGAMYQWNRKCG
jgi:hypothetical protein